MATTMIDKTRGSDADNHEPPAAADPATGRPMTDEPAASEEAPIAGDAPIADQATRVDELRSDLEVADERSEAAREAYVGGVEAGLDGDELRRLRRAWDSARAARNAVESLVMVQDPEAISTND